MTIIQAFTALWTIKIEQMVVILNFHQKIKKQIIFVIDAFKNLEKQMILYIQDIQDISKNIWNHGLF